MEPLLSDNLSGGLFDERSIVIVDSAPHAGSISENLDPMVEPDSQVVLLLVYDSDPAKIFPPQTLKKCKDHKSAAISSMAEGKNYVDH